ncbi:hypothetical protein ACFX2G_041269 [Malus domestica]
MVYQDLREGEIWHLFKEIVKQQKRLDWIIEANEERQKYFFQMRKVKVHHNLQDQWLNEDRARYYEWLDKKTSFCLRFKSIPFEEWLDQKTGRQFFASATTNIQPKKIVEKAEKEPRSPVFVVETEIMVGLEEKVQVSEQKIDLKNDSSDECSNYEQGRDIGLAEKTTPIDMIIGDKADMEKSRSVKLLELKPKLVK